MKNLDCNKVYLKSSINQKTIYQKVIKYQSHDPNNGFVPLEMKTHKVPHDKPKTTVKKL